MEKSIQINDVEIVNRQHIEGVYIHSLFNAITKFAETKQDVRNFEVYIYDEKDGVVKISFSPKQVPGKKTLGGKTDYGYGIVYFADVKTGEIIKTQLAR